MSHSSEQKLHLLLQQIKPSYILSYPCAQRSTFELMLPDIGAKLLVQILHQRCTDLVN